MVLFSSPPLRGITRGAAATVAGRDFRACWCRPRHPRPIGPVGGLKSRPFRLKLFPMPLITLDDACLAFGHVALLDKAAFQLDPGERVALIGRNGSGKSSLLKALAGQATLDDGRLWRQPGAKVAYVPQEADFPLDRSVFATVADGLRACLADGRLKELEQLAHSLKGSAGNIGAVRVFELATGVCTTVRGQGDPATLAGQVEALADSTQALVAALRERLAMGGEGQP